jgi:uncharacterized protein DUF3124
MPSIRLAICLLALCSGLAVAQSPDGGVKSQLLYLPIYSHIWHGEFDRNGQPSRSLVSVSVSIRNTDLSKSIYVTSAQYFNTEGRKLREFISAPKTIAPMGTYELFIPRSDDTGGSGANFVIAWKTEIIASPPIVEALHAYLPGAPSIVFTTSARQIARE